jgi:hypothetical protein
MVTVPLAIGPRLSGDDRFGQARQF